jgi:hypothetical protein
MFHWWDSTPELTLWCGDVVWCDVIDDDVPGCHALCLAAVKVASGDLRAVEPSDLCGDGLTGTAGDVDTQDSTGTVNWSVHRQLRHRWWCGLKTAL